MMGSRSRGPRGRSWSWCECHKQGILEEGFFVCAPFMKKNLNSISKKQWTEKNRTKLDKMRNQNFKSRFRKSTWNAFSSGGHAAANLLCFLKTEVLFFSFNCSAFFSHSLSVCLCVRFIYFFSLFVFFQVCLQFSFTWGIQRRNGL